MEKVQKTTTAKASASKIVDSKVEVAASASVSSQIVDSATEIKDVVVDAVNEITEKVDFTESVDKIKESVKVINSQLKESATEIVNEVKEMSNEIKEVATKSVKEISKKVEADLNANVEKAKADFSTNVEKVKTATKNINTQIVENTEEFKQTATKLVNDVLENINISDRLASLKDAVKSTNALALETTAELIEGLEANGLKWQGMTEKAVKSGLKLAENQQNLVFATLEAVKTQIGATAVRFKKLVAAK